MFKNYLKATWRHLLDGKSYTVINILGLALGMTIALLIGLWIKDEISFNHYFKKHDRIAQAMVMQTSGSSIAVNDFIAMPMGKAFENQYGNLFKKVALVSGADNYVVATKEKSLMATGIWAQPALPDMLTLEIRRGSINSVIDPTTVMISESLAKALYGATNPVNKTIRVSNNTDFKVGGVYSDLPYNTTFAGTKIILPWNNKENNYLNSNTDWDDHNGLLYVELAEGVTVQEVNRRIKQLPSSHIKGWKEEAMIYPLDKVHLYGKFSEGKPVGGLILFVRLFAIIGVFVLLLACINFMNLSTAQSEKRAKEVGIRKTLGAPRKKLIGQFLGESILVTLLAFILSIILAKLTLPLFNHLSQKQMHIPWDSTLFWAFAIIITALTGIIAGSYPAFYLSAFKPVAVLKGSFKTKGKATFFRNMLVIFQFTISLALVIGTLIVYRQIGYAKDRPVGYNKEGLISVNINTPELSDHYDALRQDLLQSGAVQSVAASSMPLTSFMSNNELYWKGKQPDQESLFFRNVNVTRNYGQTVGWHLTEGRDFFPGSSADSSSMILNQAAVKAIGINNPIGEIMRFGRKSYTVIGVVKDMVTNSPYEKIEPAIFLGDGYLSTIILRIRPGRPTHSTLYIIETIFKKYDPGSPFIYQFTEDSYDQKFQAETHIGNLASVFTVLAIFISCLGLFGLASFIAGQRTKEICVRKILGAGIYSIWLLLSRQFLKLVLVSLLIAIPLSYWVMHQWLQNYMFRTNMPFWIFLLAGTAIVIITLATVSYHSLKAARINPIKSLKVD